MPNGYKYCSDLAAVLFAVDLAGSLAVSVLSGSAAYSRTETFIAQNRRTDPGPAPLFPYEEFQRRGEVVLCEGAGEVKCKLQSLEA